MTDFLRMLGEFFLTGLFAFGGGLATLPFLYDMGAKTGWFGDDDILKMIALSEATPGPLGVNMATYVGFIMFGWLGGLAASLALVLPSVIVVLIISGVLHRFKNSPVVAAVFKLLRPASTGLIAAAGASVAKVTFFTEIPSAITSIDAFAAMFNYKALALGILLFVLMRKFDKVHPIFFIVGSAVLGILFAM